MVLMVEIEAPTDGVKHVQEKTCACVGENEITDGSLYITESCVKWLDESGRGFVLDYPSISLHAISRDLSAYPKPCLYIMFEGKLGIESENEEDDDEEAEVDPEPEFIEVRFIPEDVNALETMYSALCDCQLLHPDENDQLSEGDEEYDDSEEFVGGDDVRPVGVVRHVSNGTGDPMESESTHEDEGQFEDVDE